LSTTAALACLVFLAVPYYGIRDSGLGPYLKAYFKPSFILFPFHVLGELTRTLTLAVRMFGNMMSGEMIVAILLLVTPLLFPVVMRVLGLLTGMVQAFIFATLATVYIAAAARARQE
jgi:F-type H+-transporting ATPase subunit a